MNQSKTKESIAYEKELKNLHDLQLKAAISEDGIDTSKIARQKFDEIKRLLETQAKVQQKYQGIINKAQQEANAVIAKAQQDMQAEIAGIKKDVEDILKQIKIEQGVIKAEEEQKVTAEAPAVQGDAKPGD